ncbi:DUF445 domain-containing protein [Actinophytocola gossypii]|uniref:DUF445 domain-containing protein n=1 Tax=Actinophytocola gossypii TaxID=2812003 RepID=A0ABT2J3Y4_9PSEU|nr:DUF445 domain-containing protein [Actinophytocola gossypii]MCT2582570.1 DUF445 domain-containing protein [Actinophytocola gossypii]
MPLVAAVIGYLTKRAAIEMMFRPLRFVGIKEPWLGWQGVVPRHSDRMIRISADLLTRRLVDAREIFGRLDADRLVREVEGPLLLAVDDVVRDVLGRFHGSVWDALPPIGRELVVKRAQADTPVLVRRVLDEIRDNIGDVLDIERVAVAAMGRDKRLLIGLVREISRPEMGFIARCGIYFGLLLGLVQTVVWAATKEAWVLPVFGALVGWLTDWLAIKLVFFPRAARRIGPFTFQGVFQRRRDEVAKQYAEIVARDVMTVPNILDGLLRGPRSDRLLAGIRRVVRESVAEQARAVRPFMNAERFNGMVDAAADGAVRHLPGAISSARDYATRALDVRDTIASRIRRLGRVEYEGLLRPAFRQDEWKLIAVGAVIGAIIGELQVLLLLH